VHERDRQTEKFVAIVDCRYFSSDVNKNILKYRH